MPALIAATLGVVALQVWRSGRWDRGNRQPCDRAMTLLKRVWCGVGCVDVRTERSLTESTPGKGLKMLRNCFVASGRQPAASYPVGWVQATTRDSCALRRDHCCDAAFCIFVAY